MAMSKAEANARIVSVRDELLSFLHVQGIDRIIKNAERFMTAEDHVGALIWLEKGWGRISEQALGMQAFIAQLQGRLQEGRTT